MLVIFLFTFNLGIQHRIYSYAFPIVYSNASYFTVNIAIAFYSEIALTIVLYSDDLYRACPYNQAPYNRAPYNRAPKAIFKRVTSYQNLC